MTSVRTVPQQASSPFGQVAAAFQHLAARLFAAMVDVRNREHDQISRLSGTSLRYPDGAGHGDGAPRGLFDPLFSGLSANAPYLAAAVSRRMCLR